MWNLETTRIEPAWQCNVGYKILRRNIMHNESDLNLSVRNGYKALSKALIFHWATNEEIWEQWWSFPGVVHLPKLVLEGNNASTRRSQKNPKARAHLGHAAGKRTFQLSQRLDCSYCCQWWHNQLSGLRCNYIFKALYITRDRVILFKWYL